MPANQLRKSLTATIAVPAILMTVAAIALVWELNREMYDTSWVEHTDQVMLLAQTAKAEFLMAQVALRGFLISSDPNDRAPMHEHWNKSQEIVTQLASYASDNPSQEQRLIDLNGLQNQWLEAASRADSTSADPEKRDLALRAAAIGGKVIEEFDAATAEEERLRVVRDSRRDFQYTVALWSIPFAALILVIGLTGTAWREIRSASTTFEGAMKEAETANE